MPEIKQLLQDRPTLVHDLSSLCHELRNNKLCVAALGLHSHPSVESVQTRRNSFRHPLLARIIYHADPHTLYVAARLSFPTDLISLISQAYVMGMVVVEMELMLVVPVPDTMLGTQGLVSTMQSLP